MSNEIKICAALTLVGSQCKKRKKGESDFCGIHTNYKFSNVEFGDKPDIENMSDKWFKRHEPPKKIDPIKDHIISKTDDKEKKQPNWFKRQYLKIRAWRWRNDL